MPGSLLTLKHRAVAFSPCVLSTWQEATFTQLLHDSQGCCFAGPTFYQTRVKGGSEFGLNLKEFMSLNAAAGLFQARILRILQEDF